jgi:hypothetical protein
MAAIERRLSIVCENQMDGCFPYQTGTVKNPLSHWRCNRKGTQQPVLTAAPPGMPPVAPSDNAEDEFSQIKVVQPRYV